MTRTEQIDLSDSINNIHITLERATHLLDSMRMDYFDKYEPNSAKDDFAIKFYFPRMQAFASLLQDQLTAIENELPSVEWIDALKSEEATT